MSNSTSNALVFILNMLNETMSSFSVFVTGTSRVWMTYFTSSFIRAIHMLKNEISCNYPIMDLLKYDTKVWRFAWRCYITTSFPA